MSNSLTIICTKEIYVKQGFSVENMFQNATKKVMGCNKFRAIIDTYFMLILFYLIVSISKNTENTYIKFLKTK